MKRALALPLHDGHIRFAPSGDTRRPLVAHCAQLRYPVPVQYTQRLLALICGVRGARELKVSHTAAAAKLETLHQTSLRGSARSRYAILYVARLHVVDLNDEKRGDDAHGSARERRHNRVHLH